MDLVDNRERSPAYRTDEEALSVLTELNDYLGKFEERLAERVPEANQPIVVIGGLPRSGTTLLYQLLAGCCHVGYVNNVMARFWNAPRTGVVVARHVSDRGKRAALDLTSDLGATAGLAGPHEFGYFWTKWLRLDETESHLLTDEEADRVDWPGLARCLRQMAGLFGRPLVLKNHVACWNAPRLYPHLPELSLVLVQRDPYYVIQSIYLARKGRYGDAHHWWSLKPPSFGRAQAEADPIRQIVRQVVDSQAIMDQLQVRYAGACLSFEYQQIRRCPAEVLGAIAARCGLDLLDGASLPVASAFPDGDRCQLGADEERHIRQILADFETQAAGSRSECIARGNGPEQHRQDHGAHGGPETEQRVARIKAG